MKIRMILATMDREYAYRFVAGASDTLEEVDLFVCTNLDKLPELLDKENVDICLADEAALSRVADETVKLKVLLWDAFAQISQEERSIPRVRKYQRISSLVAQIIRLYADVAEQDVSVSNQANITVVWSPAGGSGKTVVAAAYAFHATQKAKNVTYLNLESFASTQALFPRANSSISDVFEQMANNMALQMLSMRTIDPSTGIGYYGAPDNYDDMNVITLEQCMEIVKAGAAHCDELVIDLPSVCDERTRMLFEEASRIILVTDSTKISEVKLQQFMSQSSTFIKFKNKITLVNNKGAQIRTEEEMHTIRVPFVESQNPATVYMKIAEFLV